ncbi:MAG: polysaccharide pyruvyl transferase CsaB [Bacillota bacterium]
MPRVVIAGYHGFGNLGDEAILQATLCEFRRLAPEVEFTVLSRDPAWTSGAYRVRSALRIDPRQVIKELRAAQMFLLGGGSLLQDMTSLRSLMYYAGLLWIGKKLTGKAMVFANGIGPITTPLGRALSRTALNGADLITLRDPDSAQTLKELGVDRQPIVTADPAFLLEPEPVEGQPDPFQAEGIPPAQGPRIVVSVRLFRNAAVGFRELARALDSVVETRKAQVVMVPMHRTMDLEPSRQVLALMKRPGFVLQRQYSPGQVLYMLAKCNAVLGTRLHSLVLGVTALVPTAGIVYDPKVESFLRELGCPCAGSLWDLNARDVVSAVEELLDRSSTIRGQLQRAKGRLVPLARKNVELALDLLYRR